jgi:hypothetical protein
VETLTVKEYDVREAKAAIGRLATVSHQASGRHAGCHSVLGLMGQLAVTVIAKLMSKFFRVLMCFRVPQSASDCTAGRASCSHSSSRQPQLCYCTAAQYTLPPTLLYHNRDAVC